MDIKQFFANYTNHPVLFVGTGISLRYLENSYSWDALLKKVCVDLTGNSDKYYDIKARHQHGKRCDYSEVALEIEILFNDSISEDRDGQFKDINDEFYRLMEKDQNVSRFKIYISKLLLDTNLKEDKREEIKCLLKVKKNIGSIITTNYDEFLDKLFDFEVLIGNDILLSNPYGSMYKIHGCINSPENIIITNADYELFDVKYELLRAQLLSIFMNNPIVFLGYNVGDENIIKLLETIFSYVEANTPEAEKIRANFLLVEYEGGSTNLEVTDHDIRLSNNQLIRINKIKTDDFISIYENLANLQIKISAMDIRKVQNIVKDIYKNGDIKVEIVEDPNDLQNKDKVLAIGSSSSITYTYKEPKYFIEDYFKIIEEEDTSMIKIMNYFKVQKNQYYPYHGFSKICEGLLNIQDSKSNQIKMLNDYYNTIKPKYRKAYDNIDDIIGDKTIAISYVSDVIYYSMYNNATTTQDLKQYLISIDDKKSSNYRKLLSLYDYKEYN